MTNYITKLEALRWCLEKPGVNECECEDRKSGDTAFVRLSTDGNQQRKNGKDKAYHNCNWEDLANFRKVEPEKTWSERVQEGLAGKGIRQMKPGELEFYNLFMSEVDRRIAEAVKGVKG